MTTTTFNETSPLNNSSIAQIAPPNPSSTEPKPGFFDAILRDDIIIDDLVTNPETLTKTIQNLLAISIFGLLVFGIIVGLVAQLGPTLHEQAIDGPLRLSGTPLRGNPILWMPLTMAGGFMTAIAICLPSFYFYTQLAGLDAPFRLITAQSIRVQARTSIVLLGIAPFYAAWALTPFIGLNIFNTSLSSLLAFGIALPFLAGFVGLYSIHSSFKRLVHRLPITHVRRGNIIRRMVLCWGAVCMSVAPVAMYRIGEFLSAIL